MGNPNATRLEMKSSPLTLLSTLLRTSDVVREIIVAASNEVVESVEGKNKWNGFGLKRNSSLEALDSRQSAGSRTQARAYNLEDTV